MSYHVLRFLFDTTKWGGWVAGACAAIAGLIAFNSNPVIHKECVGAAGISSCSDVFDEGVFVGNLAIAAAAAVLGVGIAAILVSIGVSKERLGIEE